MMKPWEIRSDPHLALRYIRDLILVESNKAIGSVDIGGADRPDALTPSGRPGPGVRQRAERGYKVIRGNYRSALISWVSAYRHKDRGYRETIDGVREVMDAWYVKAFTYGMRSVAGSSVGPNYFPLAQEHYQYLSQAAAEEAGHFENFMKDLRYKRDQRPDRMDWDNRVELYARTLDAIFDAGRVAGTGELVIFIWTLHPAEHCEGCLYLESVSPFTKNNIPTTPRAGDTPCFANCKCTMVMKKVSLDEYRAVEAQQPTADNMRQQLKTIKDRRVGTRRS